MSKYFFLLAFCFAANVFPVTAKVSTVSAPIDNPIKKIVKEIAKSNVYEIRSTAGSRETASQQSSRFQQLLQISSIDDLTELATKNKNAVVRLYAFNGLVNKLKDVPKEIVDQFRTDTTLIYVLNGNETHTIPVNKVASGLLY